MNIRTPTLFVSVLAAGLLFAACKKDANLKATKTECDDACTHATALNGGKENPFTKHCSGLCLQKEWTAGDTRCMNDAKAYDDVLNCGAVAKAVMDIKEGRAGRRENARHRRHGQGKNPQQGDPNQQQPDQGQDQDQKQD